MAGAALKLTEMPVMSTTGDVVERLRIYRTLRNMSARELSLKLGKHDTYINKLELSEFNLPMDMFFRILAELNVTSEEFFGGVMNNLQFTAR